MSSLGLSRALAYAEVPDEDKRLVNEGKLSVDEAIAKNKKKTSAKATPKRSLDTTVPDKGSYGEDLALGVRDGLNTTTSGVVGTPVNLLNAVIEPKIVGEIAEAGEKYTGKKNPNLVQLGRALFDENNETGILDTLQGEASTEAYGPRGFRQPEAVRGIQEQLAYNSQQDIKERGSTSLQAGIEAMGKAETTEDAIRTLIDNPRLASYLVAQQVPNLVINRVPGSTAGTVTAQAVNAGASAESEVYQALQVEVDAGRMTKTDQEKRSKEAGERSTLINLAMPAAFGETGRVTERLLSGQISKEVAKDVIKKSVAGATGKAVGVNAAEEYLTEGAEKVSQNISTGEDLFKGAGAAGAFGAATGATIAGPAGGFEQVAKNNQVSELSKLNTEFDRRQKELDDASINNAQNQEIGKELKKQVDEVISPTGTPVIQDLFSGQETSAEAVASKQAAIESGTSIEPEQQTETFNAKVDLAKKVEANQNKDVEVLVKEELAKQKEIKDAETVLESKYDLVDVNSIEQEAKQRLVVEQEAIANRPFNRTPEGLAQLPKTLADHRVNRMFQLKEEVKNERLAKIAQAQQVVDGVKEQEVRTKIEQQQAKTTVQPALPMKYNQQPKTKERGYTGEMTDEQKVTEARDMAFKKELASLPPEEAKVLLEETTKAQKAEVAQVAAQEKKQAAVYAKTKATARASIVDSVRASMPQATSQERGIEIGRRMTSWVKSNPLPAAGTAPTSSAPAATKPVILTVQERAKKIAATNKAKETKTENKVIDSLIKTGKLVPDKQTADEQLKVLSDAGYEGKLPESLEKKLRDELGAKEQASSSAPVRPDVRQDVRKAPSAIIKQSNAKVEESFPIYHDTVDESLDRGKEGLVDALAYMAAAPDTPEDYAKLASRLLPIVKKLNLNYGRMPEDSKDKSWGGFFDPVTNTIHIGEYSHQTLLHETLHGVIWHILNGSGPFKDNSSAKRLYSELEAIRLHMKDYINKNPTKFTSAELKYIMKYAVGPQGMLDNVQELVSYALTKGTAQSIAIKIPSNNKVKAIVDNVMDAFARAIGRMLRMESKVEQSALKDIITVTWQALDIAESNPDLMEQAATRIKEDFEGAAPTTLEDDETDAPRPTLTRTSKTVKIFGKELRVINHGTKENMIGVIQDALTSGHGLSKNLTESLEKARGLVAEYLQRAKARFDTIEKSLKDISKATGRPLLEVQNAFTKAVGDVESAADDAKDSLSNSLVRNYGDAARAYFANRAEIDLLTDKIIRERLNSNVPLTVKEAAIYSKMKQELGKYYTRSYSSNLTGVKEEYARLMIDAYNAKQEGKSSKHQDELASVMEAAIDTIHNTLVLIPDAAVLEESSLDKLRTLAATWNLKVVENDDMDVQDKKDALIEALDNFRQDKQHLNPDFTSKRALALATELLKDVEGSPIVSYLKGARADRTVVEAREKVPESIRKFLGEYDDIALKGLTTILNQAQFIFQTKALGEIRTSEAAKGKYSKVLSVEEFTERGYSPADWVVAKGESFGPLQGMYVEVSLYNRIKDLQEMDMSIPAALQRKDSDGLINAVVKGSVRGWMKSMGLIKQTQLVLNPLNAAYNLSGGANILLSNGAWGKGRGTNVKRAFDTALKLIAAQGSSSVVDPEVSRMIRLNQVDSAYLGSLRGSEMDKVKDLLLARLGEEKSGKIDKGLRWTGEKLTQAREVYAMMDVVWKIAAFYHRVDTLTKFDELNGVTRSPSDIDLQAARENSLANFSYSHVPTAVKSIEKFGPTYILPFVWESFRAPMSSMLLGIKDVMKAQNAQTSEARRYLATEGAKRALGSFSAMTVAGTAMHAGFVLLSSLLGNDEEEDQKLIEKMRPFMADYEKFDEFFVMGRNSEGHPVLFNFNRTDPFDVMARLTRMIAQDADADEYADYFKGLFITNKRAATLLDAMMSIPEEDGKRATNTRMENWSRPDFIPKDWPSIYEMLSSVADAKTVKAIDGIIPSWLTRALDSRNEILEPSNKLEKMIGVDVISAIMKFSGGQPTTVNPTKALKFAVMDYDKVKKAATEELKAVISTQEVLTPEEYAKAFISATQDEKEAFNKMAEKFVGVQGLGYDKEAAAGFMEAAGLDKRSVNSLLLGTYRPENSLLVSKKSLKALSAEIQADTSKNRDKRARNFNAALEAIDKYNIPVQGKE